MKTFKKETFDKKVMEGRFEPLTDFFGVSKDLVEVRWLSTGKKETVRVKF